jgi:riboflavin synthase
MFTGIIESLGIIKKIEQEATNIHFTIESSISNQLKIDQSIAHNGVCLTVIEQKNNTHKVTAIAETLQKSNLGSLKVGDSVNLERAMKSNARLDGHQVQGHVDQTGICIERADLNGSWHFRFKYQKNNDAYLVVDKGSICISGVSLTVVNPVEDCFSVAIIPYTIEHTIFKHIQIGDTVNLEFDIIGKYIAKYAAAYLQSMSAK